MYKRTLAKIIPESFRNGFITVIYGARRVGKTILLDQIKASLEKYHEKMLSFNGDTSEAVHALSTNSEIRLTELVKNHEIIFVDEAQKIPNITLTLKILIDRFPEKKIIVTGSSSLQLSRGAGENLTGRFQSHTLFPLDTAELSEGVPLYKIPGFLDGQLVFGGYPYVQNLAKDEEKIKYLSGIVENYLFQDVLSLAAIDYPEGFKKLATLLAFQIGREVSLSKLGNSLNLSVKTVTRYIDFLEKSFVIFSLGSYSGNMRKEVSKNKKYYFYDLGVRNALVGQFQPLLQRTDKGELWENFLFVERMKKHEYSGKIIPKYFWRNYSGTEIDLIEVENGKVSAFEFKWNKDDARTPKGFKEAYGAEVEVVNQDNYLSFILS